MSSNRPSPGSSDPLTYACTCPASTSSGLILLFYRYFTQPPSLPSPHTQLASDPSLLATYHTNLAQKYNLAGKIRIATEGFNITVGGTTPNIQNYIQELLSHWSFDGLELDSEEKRSAFFKPGKGCGCAFGGQAKVGVKEEITPLGVTGYAPADWGVVRALEPWEWHELFLKQRGGKVGEGKKRILVDVRNHYESRIGYFIDPLTNTPAIRPGIRRFSQWPGFASRFFSAPPSSVHDSKPTPGTQRADSNGEVEGREIFTYCTGGIRCEKGVRWLASHLVSSSTASQSTLNLQSSPSHSPSSISQPSDTIYTLHGGISAYLLWMDTEVALGHKKRSDSLFKGRNYVFDGRGSVGLLGGDEEKVAFCHKCGRSEDRLGKCRTNGCHLVLVVCEECDDEGGVACCGSCREGEGNGVCECEMLREWELWGGEKQARIGKGKGKGKRGGKLRDEGQGGGREDRMQQRVGGGGVKMKMRGTEINGTEINIAVSTMGR